MKYGIKIAALAASAFLPLAATSANASDWPQFRGPDRTDVSKETELLKAWPPDGPKRIWIFENAGEGYSGPAIVGGKLFIMGTRDGNEILIALDANTGQELWQTKIGSVFKESHGNGPRGTPTVDGDHVYALASEGNLVCASAADGKVIWDDNMGKLGGRKPGWGYTESPLVDGNKVVCTPGGSKGALAAFDKKTGKLIWQSTEFTDSAQYSSILPADVKGKRQYIQLTQQSIVGISASDGKVLWKEPFPGRVAVVPTPIYHDNQVYVTAGYGVGCKSIKIGPDNEVSTVYENKVIKNHHGGVILVGEYVYGHADPGWACQEFKTGKEVWNYRDFGKGAIAYADGMLYCVEERSGTVALIDASPKGWQEHGRFKLDPQSKNRAPSGAVWTHPVISNGKLYLRDQEFLYCYDIKKS